MQSNFFLDQVFFKLSKKIFFGGAFKFLADSSLKGRLSYNNTSLYADRIMQIKANGLSMNNVDQISVIFDPSIVEKTKTAAYTMYLLILLPAR